MSGSLEFSLKNNFLSISLQRFLSLHYSFFKRLKTPEALQEHVLARNVSGCFFFSLSQENVQRYSYSNLESFVNPMQRKLFKLKV